MATSLETHAFAADDGVGNQLRIARTQVPTDTLVLLLPAMGTPANKYDALLTSLAENGVHAACFDLRGHGASSVRAGRQSDFSYTKLINQDLVAALNALREEFPTHKVVLSGHSLGGQIAALYLARHPPTDVRGLCLLASCTVDYRGWTGTRKVGTLLFTQAAYLIAKLVGHLPGRQIGFAAREARGVMRDWASNARSGRYALLNDTFDYESGLARVTTPTLAINFSDDDYAPVAATERLLNKFSPQAQREQRLINAEQMGVQQAGHFTFLRHPELIATQIANWAKQLG